MLDDQLLQDVGIRLYLRCQSISTVHAIIYGGRIPCPVCAEVIRRDREIDGANYLLRCPNCAWELPWLSYWATFRHNELAYDVFVSDYVADWEKARTSPEKMLAIDRVVHRWHNDTKQKRQKFGVGRPAGVNLIEGNRRQVIDFLDSLSSGADLVSVNHAAWRKQLDGVTNSVRR